MIDSRGAFLHSRQNILITTDMQAWESLRPRKDGLDTASLENLPCAAKPCDGDFLVTRVKEPVWAYNRVDARVCGVDGDIAARKRGD